MSYLTIVRKHFVVVIIGQVANLLQKGAGLVTESVTKNYIFFYVVVVKQKMKIKGRGEGVPS